MILTSSSSRLLAPSHSHKNHFPRHPKSHLYTSSIQVPNSFTTCIFCKEVWYALLCFIENISCLTHLSSWNLTFFPSPIFQVTSKLSHLPWSFSPQTFPRSFHHIDWKFSFFAFFRSLIGNFLFPFFLVHMGILSLGQGLWSIGILAQGL